MIETNSGVPITNKLLCNYFNCLVNQFFKILPMRESEEESLPVYMQSLKVQILGSQELIGDLRNEPDYLVLPSILQYLIDHPDCPTQSVKREVFKCIRICNKLKARGISEVAEE